jgi:uncharacterized protein YkwD
LKGNPMKQTLLSALGTVMVLTACGGGGGGSTPSTPAKPDPVVTTCSNGATDFPTCSFFAANLQTTVPTPDLAIDSQEYQAWLYLNDLRTTLGLGKLVWNTSLAKTAKSHADYIHLNADSTHYQDKNKVGFTGYSPEDRAVAAGYASDIAQIKVSEGVAFGNTMTRAIKGLMDSVYHRSPLLNQGWREIGLGGHYYYYPFPGGVSVVSNPAYQLSQGQQRNATDFVLMYPYAGQSNVPLSMCGAEDPWPFPISEVKPEDACTNARYVNGYWQYDMKVGYPITFAVEANLKLTVSSFTTWENGGAPLPTWLSDVNGNGNGSYLTQNEVYLTAKVGLKPNTKYWAKFQGSANGKVIVKEWSFTTAPGF